jgi:hypothetical protein
MPLVKGSLSGKAFDGKVNTYSTALSGSVLGITKAITLGGPTSTEGNDAFGLRNYIYGMSKETTEGSPNSPCIKLEHAGTFWRFRWVLKPGQRRISIRVKQMTRTGFLRPTLIVKANTTVGLTSDLVAIAPDNDDWTVIGPIILTSTGTDMVYVQVWNNCQSTNCPLYIDRIVAT